MLNSVILYKDNLINNVKQIKKENPYSKICAMVKANAYGVGDVAVVNIINDYVDFFGVSNFNEAKRIKKYTNKKILIVGPLDRECISTDFSYACSNMEDLIFLKSLNIPVKIHFKINSGMNRFGFKSMKEFKKAIQLILKSSLMIEGIFTHFATTDEYVEKQMKEFNKYVKLLKNFKLNPIVHADNSFVNEKYNHGLDMVRIGFSLYNRSDNWFLPTVEIKSTIAEICDVKKGELIGYNYRYVSKKEMKIAIVPIGYADGFDLKYIGLSLNVDGKKCKILNICMDCFMLDISDTFLKKGDEIYLLDKFNSLKLYADHLNTSEYEIMTKFSFIRAKRIII
ncbi:MAG: alanine racemase [Clostridia bacterium]|nr:alanine racemase [Clostridia bacterium]